MSAVTGSSNTTITVPWPCNGDIDSDQPCQWYEMHHLDDDGFHWCPTGFMWCHTHGGTGEITGTGTCQAWGAKP